MHLDVSSTQYGASFVLFGSGLVVVLLQGVLVVLSVVRTVEEVVAHEPQSTGHMACKDAVTAGVPFSHCRFLYVLHSSGSTLPLQFGIGVVVGVVTVVGVVDADVVAVVVVVGEVVREEVTVLVAVDVAVEVCVVVVAEVVAVVVGEVLRHPTKPPEYHSVIIAFK